MRLGGKSALDFRTNPSLTALKQGLTNLLICSTNSLKALPSHGNLRYTGHFSGSNLVLVENYIHLYLMVQVILSSGYQSFKIVVLIKLILSVSFDFEQIIKTR